MIIKEKDLGKMLDLLLYLKRIRAFKDLRIGFLFFFSFLKIKFIFFR